MMHMRSILSEIPFACTTLNLYMLLCLDCLMQTIGITMVSRGARTEGGCGRKSNFRCLRQLAGCSEIR